MSKHLKALKLFYQTEDTTDHKVGQVWAIDGEGEWFYYSNPYDPNPSTEAKSWPNKQGLYIHLYRDYWRHSDVKSSVGAPYYDEIRNMSTKKIKGLDLRTA